MIDLNEIELKKGLYCTICELKLLRKKKSNISISNFHGLDLSSEPVTIGNDVTILNGNILEGVSIGNGCVIDTTKIIDYNVPDYSIVDDNGMHLKYSPRDVEFLSKNPWWNLDECEIQLISEILKTNNISKYREYIDNRLSKTYKGFKVAIYTRSMNDKLYEMMRNTIDSKFDFIRVTDAHGVGGASEYLYRLILDKSYDYVINIDEDMYVYDFKKVLTLLDYMIDNKYDYCGIPDGGACTHRFHSPIVMNPFFNIFNTKDIRDALDVVSYVEGFKYNTSMDKFIPFNKIKPGYYWVNDNFEPFYPLFYWLPVRGFKPLYLDSYEIDDGAIFEKGNPNNGLAGISTIVKNNLGEDIGIHTWYSRVYDKDAFHTERINSAYKLALSKKELSVEDILSGEYEQEVDIVIENKPEIKIHENGNEKVKNDNDLLSLDKPKRRKKYENNTQKYSSSVDKKISN